MSALEPSIHLLRRAATPHGFVASVQNVSNYQRIWTRDGVITGLAALLTDDSGLADTLDATLQTVFEAQHTAGFFPSNVDPQTRQASYGGNCGRVDNVSWAIIGLLQHAHITGSTTLAQACWPQVQRGLAVLEAWEFNGKHLVYVPQSGDWADEYVQHGYVLYDQLLRVWALELAGHYYQRPQWLQKAATIRQVLVRNYWNDDSADAAPLYAPNLEHQRRQAPRTFWLMGFNPARVYQQFDLAANALALLLDLGTAAQQATLVAYLREQLHHQPFLLPAFAPALSPTDGLMAELTDNYAYEFRNRPHEFHNGGLWPVWNGWLAAALHQVGEPGLANQLTGHLHAANQQNPTGTDWGFYENFHGLTHAPIGVAYCTWSAAGQLLAEAYAQGRRLWVPAV
ncbi:glycoside hydrolase 100 family protein [Hymenobacter wooponensis]|uniref:beta-fructofuranosidase n=1 Tax=Hymenobacter wooponensis TaxID=1525360 RepID=A0A4Z0MJA0_9BACT|nr:glycoside hydrolase 100 family protein [Hymenobacter wooponensis]TGD79539.1 fructofuranosidase/invertase [Hymenobacter wooponensis]